MRIDTEITHSSLLIRRVVRRTKRKAYEQWHNVDYEWWDCVYEDATEVGKTLGIDVDKIYFSGFSSQGDGACFEGVMNTGKGLSKPLKNNARMMRIYKK